MHVDQFEIRVAKRCQHWFYSSAICAWSLFLDR